MFLSGCEIPTARAVRCEDFNPRAIAGVRFYEACQQVPIAGGRCKSHEIVAISSSSQWLIVKVNFWKLSVDFDLLTPHLLKIFLSRLLQENSGSSGSAWSIIISGNCSNMTGELWGETSDFLLLSVFMSPCSLKSYFLLLFFWEKQNRHETIFDMQIKNKRRTKVAISVPVNLIP